MEIEIMSRNAGRTEAMLERVAAVITKGGSAIIVALNEQECKSFEHRLLTKISAKAIKRVKMLSIYWAIQRNSEFRGLPENTLLFIDRAVWDFDRNQVVRLIDELSINSRILFDETSME